VAKITTRNIKEFQDKLLQWYILNGRQSLPWRDKNLSSYELVIAEILLQRTKAETISKYYLNFLTRFPSWQSLADADLNNIQDFLKPIGLFRQRSIRLKSLAIEMVKRNGCLPKDRLELESIPFIGQYIANAIELLIFAQTSYLLDVNMARVLERYFGTRKLADIRYDPYLQDLAFRVINHEKSKELNWAILDFAASICKARRPLCKDCVIAYNCNYFKTIVSA